MSTTTHPPAGIYSTASPTSQAAAARVDEENAATQARKVLRALWLAGINGCTREELQATCEMSGDATRPRVKGLMARGLVEVSDEIRKTASGRSAEVLVLTDAGRRAMGEPS